MASPRMLQFSSYWILFSFKYHTVSCKELRPKMFSLITPQIKDEVICFFLYLKSLWNVVLDFDIKLDFWFRNGWLTCKTKIKVDTHEIPFFISSNISSSDWHQRCTISIVCRASLEYTNSNCFSKSYWINWPQLSQQKISSQ